MGVGLCQISWKKHYKGVRFNIISITRGWLSVKYPGEKTLRNTRMAPKNIHTFDSSLQRTVASSRLTVAEVGQVVRPNTRTESMCIMGRYPTCFRVEVSWVWGKITKGVMYWWRSKVAEEKRSSII